MIESTTDKHADRVDHRSRWLCPSIIWQNPAPDYVEYCWAWATTDWLHLAWFGTLVAEWLWKTHCKTCLDRFVSLCVLLFFIKVRLHASSDHRIQTLEFINIQSCTCTSTKQSTRGQKQIAYQRKWSMDISYPHPIFVVWMQSKIRCNQPINAILFTTLLCVITGLLFDVGTLGDLCSITAAMYYFFCFGAVIHRRHQPTDKFLMGSDTCLELRVGPKVDMVVVVEYCRYTTRSDYDV